MVARVTVYKLKTEYQFLLIIGSMQLFVIHICDRCDIRFVNDDGGEKHKLLWFLFQINVKLPGNIAQGYSHT